MVGDTRTTRRRRRTRERSLAQRETVSRLVRYVSEPGGDVDEDRKYKCAPPRGCVCMYGCVFV
jgi:hypothetical protein